MRFLFLGFDKILKNFEKSENFEISLLQTKRMQLYNLRNLVMTFQENSDFSS